MTTNFAYDNDPKDWTEYKSHTWQVELVKNWISTELPQCIFITGRSGVGKTSLVRLLIKSVHCLNRKPGEYQPCNECKKCKVDPRTEDRAMSNVVWVQGGVETDMSLNAQVDYAIQRAQTGPYRTGNPHRDILFIVMDEWSPSINRAIREKVLFWSEVELESVLFIFISMRHEDLDANEFNAQSSRGRHLHLEPFSNELISKILQEKLNADPEVADIISSVSDGSVRKAYSLYANCLDLFPITSPQIAQLVTGGATKQERDYLWNLVYNSRLKEMRNFITNLSNYSSEERLAEQLLRDVEEELSINPKEEHLLMIKHLTDYLIGGKGKLYYYLLPMCKIKWK